MGSRLLGVIGLMAALAYGCTQSGGSDNDDDSGLQCRLNSDCPLGEVCRASHCVVECREERDCEDGQRCIEGECREPIRPDGMVPDPDSATPPDPDAATPPDPDAATPPDPDAAVPPDPDAAIQPVPDADVNADPGYGRLTFDCRVPYILDESRATDLMYLTEHFNHLVQQHCITGRVGGLDIANFPEKMYYGAHPPGGNYVALQQVSMTDALAPRFSVKVIFEPDDDVTNGSEWGVGRDPGSAVVMLIQHRDAGQCILSVGQRGVLRFDNVVNVTANEGGSFDVSGTVDVMHALDAPALCGMPDAGIDCCF